MDNNRILYNELIFNSMGCIHKYVAEKNPEYTIVYCTLHNKEISQHGDDCVSCKYNPYYKENI